jgi:O-antigen ligase
LNIRSRPAQPYGAGTNGDQLGSSPALPDDSTIVDRSVPGAEINETSATNSDHDSAYDDAEETTPEQGGGMSLTLTYVGVFLFCAAYFFRLQDYIPALAFIPLGKITGVIAGLSLLLVVLSGALRLRTEMKWLLALFGWLVLCIPFSYWRGGSFHTVVLEFGKMVFIAVAASVAVNSWSRLRRMMVLQTIAMLAMSVLAFGAQRRFGRMYATGNMFSDPNDFALQLCIVLPFCVALLRTSRSWIGKLWWLTSIFAILVAIVETYSRGGFLALIATLFFIWRRFKPSLSVALPLSVLALVIGAGFIAIKAPSYIARMSAITDVDSDASSHQRKELLIESLRQTMLHPIFGVGPGQFEEISGAWRETHNTYTQFSSEAGLPALVLFLLFLRSGFRRLREKRTGGASEESSLASALQCSLAAYMVGAFFLSTAYWLTPSLLVAYAAASLGTAQPHLISES